MLNTWLEDVLETRVFVSLSKYTIAMHLAFFNLAVKVLKNAATKRYNVIVLFLFTTFHCRIAEKFNPIIQSPYWCFEIGRWFFPYCAPIGWSFLRVPLWKAQKICKILLDMYRRSKMPLFDWHFTEGFLLRNSSQLYNHHTGVLKSVDGFGHTAR